MGLRLEIAASSEDHRPCLSDNLSSGRNGDRIRDVVYSRIEKNDLASSILRDKHVNMAIPFCIDMNYTWLKTF